jgi:hypothetical protein
MQNKSSLILLGYCSSISFCKSDKLRNYASMEESKIWTPRDDTRILRDKQYYTPNLIAFEPTWDQDSSKTQVQPWYLKLKAFSALRLSEPPLSCSTAPELVLYSVISSSEVLFAQIPYSVSLLPVTAGITSFSFKFRCWQRDDKNMTLRLAHSRQASGSSSAICRNRGPFYKQNPFGLSYSHFPGLLAKLLES